MIGDNIKSLMKANGYTQKQLAMRAGCTEAAISHYVNGDREPSVRLLKNLAIALGVSVERLISGVDVVEVVRCKDCKYRFEPTRCSLWYGECDGKQYFRDHGNDFYCSYGKRREK